MYIVHVYMYIYNVCMAHVMVDFLESVLSECGQRCRMSAPQSDGVMDALQYSQLTQVHLGRLRLWAGREGGREGGRQGGRQERRENGRG